MFLRLIFLKNLHGVKIGYNENNNFQINNLNETLNGITFTLNNKDYSFKLNGKHNSINASLAISIAKTLGLTDTEIQQGLNNSSISPMRFERILKNDILYINDAYNASPVAMKSSLDTFQNILFSGKKLAVLGDMAEMGLDEINYHKDVLNFALTTNIHCIIAIGPKMKEAAKQINNKKIIICDTKDEIRDLIKTKFNSYIIFLKASNSSRLWEIIN